MSTSTCSDPACERPAKKAGLCATHYERQRRGGGAGPIRPRGKADGGKPRGVYLGDEPWQRLAELAKARGVSASELVRQAVARWLAELDLQMAQDAHEEACAALRRLPGEAPEASKLAALERVGATFDQRLLAERALRPAGGRP